MKALLKFFADAFTRDLIDRWFVHLECRERDDLDRLAAQQGLLNKAAVKIRDRMVLTGSLALLLAVFAPLCIVWFTQGAWRSWLVLLYALYPLPVIYCWSELAGRTVRLQGRFTSGELFIDDQLRPLTPFEQVRWEASLRDAVDHYDAVRWLVAPIFALMTGYILAHHDVWSVAVLFFEHDFRLLWMAHKHDLMGTMVVVILSGFYFFTLILPVTWLKRRHLDLENWKEFERLKD